MLCLVGVGSLGSFLAKQLQSKVDTIYAVDPDKVEERNLRNSVYTKADINKPKVMALKEQISECTFVPIQSDIRQVDLPRVDTVVDCRDVIPRNIDTDVKFSVVGRHLKVDCQEVNADIDRNGKYMLELERPEVSRAGGLAQRILMSDQFPMLKSKGVCIHVPIEVQSVDLNALVNQKDETRTSCQLLYDSPISVCEMFDIGGA